MFLKIKKIPKVNGALKKNLILNQDYQHYFFVVLV
tara:strand:+ start:132 stop:236 length:105 start_codon:yes stop_codon:yes gene_type:complete